MARCTKPPAGAMLVSGQFLFGVAMLAHHPTGFSILRVNLPEGSIHAGRLFPVALDPTLVGVAAFRLL